MLSLIKNLWNAFDSGKQHNELQKKYEEGQQRLETVLCEENDQLELAVQSSAANVLGAATNSSPNKLNFNGQIDKRDCFKKMGVLTNLKSNHGIIDHSLFFDINVALNVFNELKIGCRVEYLAFKNPNNDLITVVKIEKVIDLYWDDDMITDDKINEHVSELKIIEPTYFNTQQRNILGLITERKGNSIVIDTDYKQMDVDLDGVEIDFVPNEGDRIYACCNVQVDEHFVDKQGEILQVVSIHPTRVLKQEICTVRKVHSDWGQLNHDAYYKFDVSHVASKLNEGDVVNADLIECEVGNSKYIWRCIRLSLVECAPSTPAVLSPKEKSSLNNNHAVTITNDIRCFFTSTFEKQEAKFSIVNNCDRKVVVKSIEIKKRNALIQLISPKPSEEPPLLTLRKGETADLCFEVESRSYGETRELFVICFEKFRIHRAIHIIVCDSQQAADAARAESHKENIIGENEAYFRARNYTQRSRFYANQVWSSKHEVVPGVNLYPRRRFVANKIGFNVVPERMRDAYLSAKNNIDMIDNIEAMFSYLKEELNISNYSRRFQTLLHLEEIEYFINFRNYDRERAHFTRDGEYLSLAIENLAERRPSLVIGDIVRAINPWVESDTCDTRSFDGVVHKVLFDHILLKFNSGFQSKYNGEDYRLEFHFSRYGFRKQHYSVNRIVRHLGERFLFPSKVNLREQMQLDIKLDDDLNLSLPNTECRWYNQSLNAIQKKAICNILRGETERMAYVIFGPPGTGKTITLVETILQIIKLIPSARILVGTPSNSSADLITTRLIDSGFLQPGDFVRLVSQTYIEKDIMPAHLLPYCATADIGVDGTCSESMIVTESGLKLKCQMKYLGRHRATISTCSTLGTFLQMDFPKDHFTHVLIDESGQCTEPEVMIAISQVSEKRGQVILVGDPNQLPAVVVNRYSGDRGLSLSFLQRTLERAPYSKDNVRFPDTCGYNPRLVTKLIYNYRSLPSILNVYSDLFYESELLPKVEELGSREANMLIKLDVLLPKSEKRSNAHGAFFYGVRSENMQERDSPSWYNPIEAKNVFLMTIQLYRQRIQPESIGIVTPYLKQVKHLRNLFVTADIAMPKIGTVEEFQGQERDIILISTVRSTKKLVFNDLRYALGFVRCPKRMNVAISRARYLLFVFGNPHLLTLDKCWRSYIKYCVDNEAYLGCDLPEDIEQMEDEVFNVAE